MATERFYSRFPLWILWIGLVSTVVNLSHDLWQFVSLGATLEGDGIYTLIGAGCSALGLIFFAFGVRNRLRSPAVKVSDEAIEHSAWSRMFLPRSQDRIRRANFDCSLSQAPSTVTSLPSGLSASRASAKSCTASSSSR